MIVIKSKSELQKMREAGKLLSELLHVMEEAIRPGVTTGELDRLSRQWFSRHEGATPTFLGYGGFPGTLCISVDNQVIHGIPGDLVLQDGSLVKLDGGVTYRGYCADAARTIPVGKVSEEAMTLLTVTKESFFQGARQALAGNRLGDISHAIEAYVTSFGFSVVRDFVGHGIGKNLHEGPEIPNYGEAGRGPRLREGMTLAIEPMVNAGHHAVKILDDGWTVITLDGKLSAHYENTVAVTDGEPEILTL